MQSLSLMKPQVWAHFGLKKNVTTYRLCLQDKGKVFWEYIVHHYPEMNVSQGE